MLLLEVDSFLELSIAENFDVLCMGPKGCELLRQMTLMQVVGAIPATLVAVTVCESRFGIHPMIAAHQAALVSSEMC